MVIVLIKTHAVNETLAPCFYALHVDPRQMKEN